MSILNKTSSEAYEEYQKLKQFEEKLKKQNKGLNIINSNNFKPNNYFVEVKKVSKINLAETSSKLVVNTNLPFTDWRYIHNEMGTEDFLEELKKWVKMPRYEFYVQYNRKRDNKSSWFNLPTFRNCDIIFDNINFDIGEQANHEINLSGFDFLGTIKKILSEQREATEEESKDFERFRFLIEEVDNLKRQIAENTGYFYEENKDKTFKIVIDKKTYNGKLKIIEEEFKILCKKYSFLDMPTIYYKDIIKQLSFEDWKSETQYETEGNWDELDDEEKNEYDGDFEDYLKVSYDDYLGENNFDE